MRLATLDRKLLRDLKRLRTQAIAVSAVLACGVALFVMATGMYDSLERARDNYYDAARMAPPEASRVHGPSLITETVKRQDEAFAQLGGNIDRFAAAAPLMSQQELVAATTKIQFEAAQMVCKMYGGQMVAQGVKTSVQTLMKNQ